MTTLTGRRAGLWFGKRVRSEPGTELGPDNAGRYGKVSQTGRYFTYEWWFGHHQQRDGDGTWDETEQGKASRESWGRSRGRTRDAAAPGQRRPSKAARSRESAHAYEVYLNERYEAADTACRGVMVSKAGRAKGYTGADFFDANASRRPGRRWMSDELRGWFGDGDAAGGTKGSRGGILSATAYASQTRERAAA